MIRFPSAKRAFVYTPFGVRRRPAVWSALIRATRDVGGGPTGRAFGCRCRRGLPPAIRGHRSRWKLSSWTLPTRVCRRLDRRRKHEQIQINESVLTPRGSSPRNGWLVTRPRSVRRLRPLKTKRVNLKMEPIAVDTVCGSSLVPSDRDRGATHVSKLPIILAILPVTLGLSMWSVDDFTNGDSWMRPIAALIARRAADRFRPLALVSRRT